MMIKSFLGIESKSNKIKKVNSEENIKKVKNLIGAEINTETATKSRRSSLFRNRK